MCTVKTICYLTNLHQNLKFFLQMPRQFRELAGAGVCTIFVARTNSGSVAPSTGLSKVVTVTSMIPSLLIDTFRFPVSCNIFFANERDFWTLSFLSVLFFSGCHLFRKGALYLLKACKMQHNTMVCVERSFFFSCSPRSLFHDYFFSLR